MTPVPSAAARAARLLAATVAAVALSVTPAAALPVVPPPAVHAAAARIPAAPVTPALTLAGISPTVAVPGTDVTLRITVRNTADEARTPTVSVAVGSRLLTREDVARHADRPSTDLRVLATQRAPQLTPGSAATVTVTLPASRLTLPRPYGVLPVTVTAAGIDGAPPMATFLPYQVRKEYQPLRLGVALPLTADATPTLLTGTAARRAEARAAMLAPGTRLDRIVQAADSTGATLVADPALLGAADPGPTPTETGGPTTTPTPTASAPTDPTAAFAGRVASTGNDVWFLPPGDPDVSALAAARPDGALPSWPEPPATVPGTRREALSVVWPAGSFPSRVRDAAATALTPAAMLMSESRADENPLRTGSASRRDDAGHRVLVTDDRLSDDLAHVTRATAPADGQRALADSVALLAESPGLDRAVLLLPDRGLDPDPVALTGLVRTLQSAPWITPVTTADIAAAPATSESIDTPQTTPDAPPSPITADSLPRVEKISRLADGLQTSFRDGLVPEDVTQIATSTRWRGRGEEWTSAIDTLEGDLRRLSGGVRVVPSAVNFFAEHGVLQITVVNDLDVEVRDVRLRADVGGRPGRLRILGEPEPLTIRPRSRTTVRLDVEAVAAGLVPVRTSLRTAGGAALGQDATVQVRVQPTNGWILLAAGGVVGVVFLMGLFRAIKAGERRVAEADLRDLDLD